MRKMQESLNLHGKIVYWATTDGGWSITIMPDEIVINNYHSKGGHIHTDPGKHYIQEKIKHEDQKNNLTIVFNHIKMNKGLKLPELIKELK